MRASSGHIRGHGGDMYCYPRLTQILAAWHSKAVPRSAAQHDNVVAGHGAAREVYGPRWVSQSSK